jgi:EAL domain-containing protein (putative c-di-GMP-specific phosphodiesterase class I)
MFPPDSFIPIAERTGLIGPMTDMVLRMALAQGRRWLDEGLALNVSVNLSARSLGDVMLPARVAQLLEEYRVPPHLLTLEITESSVMSDVQKSLPILSQLADVGVLLSVDDFGTGYSSLAYLRRLPVQEVKIDKSFVLTMCTDVNGAVIVQTIIALGHQLGLRVVAEGVEDAPTLSRLGDMGCDVMQGYLASRPVPPDHFGAWLAGYEAARVDAPEGCGPLLASRSAVSLGALPASGTLPRLSAGSG